MLSAYWSHSTCFYKRFSVFSVPSLNSVETAEKRCACDSGKGCHEFDVTDLQCATAREKKKLPPAMIKQLISLEAHHSSDLDISVLNRRRRFQCS